MGRYLALPARLRHKQAASSHGGRHPDAGNTAQEPVAIQRRSVQLDPRECALLVLGCQKSILDAVPHADALILKINAAIDIVRLHGGHIGFVRIAFDDLDYRFTPTTNKEFSKLAQQRRLQNGTPESAINQALTVHPADIVVRTTRLGAFSTTDLDEQLTNLGITTLIVAGAHTSGTVLSTVREAADRDYRLIFLSDCCGDPDTETHRFLMTRIFPRQAENTTAADLYMSLATDKVDRPQNSVNRRASQAVPYRRVHGC